MSISRFLVAASLVICLGLPLGVMLDAQPAKLRKPTATPVELIRAKKDFKVELLYSVPRETQGSWVSLCVDPKGRLITSDQYGKLYPHHAAGHRRACATKPRSRNCPSSSARLRDCCGPSIASTSSSIRAGSTAADSGVCSSSKNDDVLDTKEKLRGIDGGGEHGPHAVVLGPTASRSTSCAAITRA